QDQRLTFVRNGFRDLGCVADVQRRRRACLCRNRSRAGDMTDGIFFVRSGVEDDRTAVVQRRSQLCSADLGTTCDIAQDSIEDVWRITSVRCELRLRLRRSGYGTHQRKYNEQCQSTLLPCRHRPAPIPALQTICATSFIAGFIDPAAWAFVGSDVEPACLRHFYQVRGADLARGDADAAKNKATARFELIDLAFSGLLLVLELISNQPKSGARAGATSASPETSNRTSTSLRKPASSRCP